MAGPFPQYPDAALSQPNYTEPYPSYPYPDENEPPEQRYQPAPPSVYPGPLPAPVPYPGRRRWRLAAVILLVIAIVAGATTAIVFAVRSGPGDGELTEASAKTAIQAYLDAMLNGDTEIVAENMGCGLYDAVKNQKSDEALARLSSETFSKQFSAVDVTSIDKMVFYSTSRAQVLFSMQVVPVTRGAKAHEQQAVADLLLADDQLLVCQYVLRSGGQY